MGKNYLQNLDSAYLALVYSVIEYEHSVQFKVNFVGSCLGCLLPTVMQSSL